MRCTGPVHSHPPGHTGFIRKGRGQEKQKFGYVPHPCGDAQHKRAIQSFKRHGDARWMSPELSRSIASIVILHASIGEDDQRVASKQWVMQASRNRTPELTNGELAFSTGLLSTLAQRRITKRELLGEFRGFPPSFGGRLGALCSFAITCSSPFVCRCRGYSHLSPLRDSGDPIVGTGAEDASDPPVSGNAKERSFASRPACGR
jgi:hypothetical protein